MHLAMLDLPTPGCPFMSIMTWGISTAACSDMLSGKDDVMLSTLE